MLHLDNDVHARFARAEPDPAVVEYLKQRSDEQWAISPLLAYEFVTFITNSRRKESFANWNRRS